MNVHWVVERNGVLKDDADGFVTAEVVCIPLWVEGVRDISFVSQKEEGIVVIAAECLSLPELAVVLLASGTLTFMSHSWWPVELNFCSILMRAVVSGVAVGVME